MKCNLCPRKCNIERTQNENLKGYCKMPLQPRAARACLHFGEEPCISGQNGSGTVFFSGCSLSCVYCQNSEISHGNKGKPITPEHLAQIFKQLEEMGAHNINLVSPTHFALAIKEALENYRPKIPIVYNSSGYENVSTLKMLEDYIDIYLLDFKYMYEQSAQEFSAAPNYPEAAKKAALECYRQKSQCVFDKNGIMKRGVIIRHLLLPQATREAIEIFEFVKDNLPNAYFSIMSQYLPLYKAHEHKKINRKVTKREYDKILEHITESGFANCYIQHKSSATKEFIPDFDLSGI